MFTIETKDDVLYLTLDTKGSAVNVFNLETSSQLIEILAALPADVRAVVFRSGKPGSFINGVGMLMSHSLSSHDGAVELSRLAREAYAAVRRCKVPTIAAMEGTVWGCGVEFVLNCSHRIAADTYDTHVYMTELNDYLFIPCFGATRNLPYELGLRHAIDLLLWGDPWSARQAVERGLFNEVVAREDAMTEATNDFVRRVLSGHVPAVRADAPRKPYGSDDDVLVAETRERIAKLPPHYRAVYDTTLDMMVTAAQRAPASAEELAAEIRVSGESAMSGPGKAAHAFFFIRQMAARHTLSVVDQRPVAYRVHLPTNPAEHAPEHRDAGEHPFVAKLRSRRVRQTVFDGVGPDGAIPIHVRMANDPAASEATSVVVCTDLAAKRASLGDVVAFAPMRSEASRFVEISVKTESSLDKARHVANYLRLVGFQVALSRAPEDFGLAELFRGYFAPLVRAVLRGVQAGRIHTALSHYGFVRLPHDLLESLDIEALVEVLAPSLVGTSRSDVGSALAALRTNERASAPDASVTDAILLSLHGAALRCIERRAFHHPTLIDLAAREVFDFPIAEKSLCSVLTRAKIRELLGRTGVTDLAPPSHAQIAFAEAGRAFYL